eukprot:688271-Prorocentrum_minimum.AAC.1
MGCLLIRSFVCAKFTQTCRRSDSTDVTRNSASTLASFVSTAFPYASLGCTSTYTRSPALAPASATMSAVLWKPSGAPATTRSSG